jgi:plastocyanin
MRRPIAVALFLAAALPALTLVSCSSSSGNKTTTAPPAALELDSPVIAASSGTYTHRFFSAGTFPYHCTIHSGMTGASVTVSNSAPAGDTVGGITIIGMTSPFYSPNTLTLHTGGKVTWTNGDGVPHTVTSN